MRQKKSQEEKILCFLVSVLLSVLRNMKQSGLSGRDTAGAGGGGEYGFKLSLKYLTEDIE